MRIAIIGCGYVGLVSGTCLAEFGHTVTCVDSDPARIAALRRGEVPVFEPGLAGLLAVNVAAGRLDFSTDLATAVAGAEIVFIAVGTPSRRGDGHADLSFVHEAAAEIARSIEGFTVIVTKSTVPVGTGDTVERIIREASPQADFVVVSNPEFLREGAAIEDFQRPDRIVLGIDSERARAPMLAVYEVPLGSGIPVHVTGRRSAELLKYASNAFLAMKVSFINEIADLCEAAGADIDEVASGMGLDRRIGAGFLQAGPGYGGSCFPKDTRALVRTAAEFGRSLRLVEATAAVNAARVEAMADRIAAACGGAVRGKTVTVLGLTFKANTDDLREAPALRIIAGLQAAGAEVVAFDPQGMAAAGTILAGVKFAADPYDAAAGADCLVIVTEWDEFRALDLARLRTVMRRPVLVDLRNLYRRGDVEAQGFVYDCIGRPPG